MSIRPDYVEEPGVRKNNSVQLAIISSFGAFGRQSQRMLKFYSRRARDKKHGRDATRYSRYRTASYLSHVSLSHAMQELGHVIDCSSDSRIEKVESSCNVVLLHACAVSDAIEAGIVEAGACFDVQHIECLAQVARGVRGSQCIRLRGERVRYIAQYELV